MFTARVSDQTRVNVRRDSVALTAQNFVSLVAGVQVVCARVHVRTEPRVTQCQEIVSALRGMREPRVTTRVSWDTMVRDAERSVGARTVVSVITCLARVGVTKVGRELSVTSPVLLVCTDLTALINASVRTTELVTQWMDPVSVDLDGRDQFAPTRVELEHSELVVAGSVNVTTELAATT